MASFTPNNNPRTSLLHFKDFVDFIVDLVIDWFGHRFEKTSSCKSIPCCLFTEILGIIICFWVRIEAAGNIYNLLTVCSKLGTDNWQQTTMTIELRKETVQNFLFKVGMNPQMHVLKRIIFVLNNIIIRLTKIKNRADKNRAHF